MKYVAVVNRFFPDSPGGSARVAWDIACLARDEGHRVTMICAAPNRTLGSTERSQHEGITVVTYGCSASWAGFTTARHHADGMRSAFSDVLKGLAADVIHLHSLLPAAALMRILGRDQPYIATVHSPVVPEQRLNWEAQGLIGRAKIGLGGLRRLRSMQQEVFDDCRRIHVLSEYTRAELTAYHNKLPPCFVVPHWRPDGIQATNRNAARAQLGWSKDERRIFSVRRMVPRMGHAVAIKALAPILDEYNAKLVLAGAGPLLNQLRALADRTRGGDRIEFPGRISEAALRAMYCAADLFLLPTMALECFGLILLEAMGYDIPVLATCTGAVPEVLGPILPDYLVAPGNIDALREKAEAFLSGSLARPQVGSLAAFVNRNYAQSIIAPRLSRVLFDAPSL